MARKCKKRRKEEMMEKDVIAATETTGGIGTEVAVENIELAEDGDYND